MKIITLLTDFGLKDPYAGIMKGVILSINPDVTIVDISHEVEAQDIREGAFLIKEYYTYFEKGTIHVAIVDPTVGSERRPIVFSKDGYFFIGPDNGIFTLVIDEDTEIYLIENKKFMMRTISTTFHGRDVFAPVAAHLSLGFHLSAFGEVVTDPVCLTDIFPKIETDVIYGEVVRFDRFGNAITNIHASTLNTFIKGKKFSITIGKTSFESIDKSYYEKEVTCLIGSAGYLEFAYYRGSFREEKKVWKGDEVTVRVE